MKNKFAKLFEFEENQVLVTKHDEEVAENEFKVIQTTYCELGHFDLAVGFDDEEKRDLYFDEYGEGIAIEFLDIVNNLCNGIQD